MHPSRLLALLLAFALLAAACATGDPGAADGGEDVAADDEAEEVVDPMDGGDDDAADDAATDDDADADDADADATAEVGDGELDLPIWIAFTDYRLDWMVDVAEEFVAAHPEYSVSVQGYDSYETLFQGLNLAAEQGNPPAVAQYFEAATQEARDAVTPDGEPLFASVEAELDGRDEVLGEPVVLGDVVEAAANYYTTDGEFTSMPWNTSSTLLYGNRELLDDAGVDGMPETWDELEAACEAVLALEDGPDNCISWPNHGWFFEQSVALQGGEIVNNGNGREGRADEVLLDSEQMLEYVSWWSEMTENGNYVYTGTQNDWDGPRNAFNANQIAFVSTSSGDATMVVDEAAEAGFTADVGPYPYNGDVERDGALIGGATLWLLNGLEPDVQEGALAFMQFVNSPENAADWHRVTGYIPITNASVDLLEKEGWFEENPYQRVATDQLDAASGSTASSGALSGAFVGIRAVVTQAMEDVLVSGADPEERFVQASDEANQLLDEYNLLYAEQG